MTDVLNSLGGTLERKRPLNFFLLAPVSQKLGSAIHRINRYPDDKYYENQLRYPLDSNLSSE